MQHQQQAKVSLPFEMQEEFEVYLRWPRLEFRDEDFKVMDFTSMKEELIAARRKVDEGKAARAHE